jgi:hypothetical protein
MFLHYVTPEQTPRILKISHNLDEGTDARTGIMPHFPTPADWSAWKVTADQTEIKSKA